MTSSLLTWVALAVLLFWSVGAYNRLVRLRSEVNTAFGVLFAELQRQVQLVQSLVADDAAQPPSERASARSRFFPSLSGAAAQLAASLTAARSRPLDPHSIAALAAAGDVLAMAWERAEREDAHDMSGPSLPDNLPATRMQLNTQVLAAATQFNDAVHRYNASVGQFPALVLAWVFGFKPGQTL